MRRGSIRSTAAILATALALAACTSSAATPGDDRERARASGSAPAGPSPAPSPPATEPSEAPEPAASPTGDGRPRFEGSIARIGPAERAQLVPRNWRRGCPVPLEDLRWLTVSYWGFGREVKEGPLVVHERVADDVLWVFERLFRMGFPIQEIALPRRYRPDRDRWDDRHNRSSAFNCRPVTDNPGRWSQHAYGWAIDLNPVQNPYVRGDGSVLRKVAKPYRDRTLDHPGMINEGSPVVRLFDRIGWEWGGRWSTLKDYMHFSATGG